MQVDVTFGDDLDGVGGKAGMVIAAAQLGWQVVTLDIDDPENCLRRFRSNRDFGALVLAAILVDMALAALT